jgi:prophage antirepressor-like protein
MTTTHSTEITLNFSNIELAPVEHQGQLWLTTEQVGLCLGYSRGNARDGIIKLYNRHEDEFKGTAELTVPSDTCVTKFKLGIKPDPAKSEA